MTKLIPIVALLSAALVISPAGAETTFNKAERCGLERD